MINFEHKLLIAPPPLEQLSIANNINNYGCTILRLDKINALYGGNKYFKLKQNLKTFFSGDFSCIISFGGAYSNHIYSLAAIGKELGIKTIGIIRGLEPENLSSTLNFAKECGMELLSISRTEYSLKNDEIFLEQLRKKHPKCLIIPEGGSNELGIEGCKEITNLIPFDFNYIVLPCGTGSTLSGIVSSLKPHQKAVGISVLKGEDTFTRFVLKQNLGKEKSFTVLHDYNFGGYAKKDKTLLKFITEFKLKHKIPLDFVYSAKAMFALINLIEKSYFLKDSQIVFVHTGGLQNGAMCIAEQ